MQSITLHLPDTIMQRAKTAAQVLQQPLEDVLTAMLTASLPELEDVPVNMRAELAQMTWLNTQELWVIARSQLSKEKQTQLQTLSSQQKELTQEETEQLEVLRQSYGQITLRKARAYALLSLRAGQPLLAKN